MAYFPLQTQGSCPAGKQKFVSENKNLVLLLEKLNISINQQNERFN